MFSCRCEAVVVGGSVVDVSCVVVSDERAVVVGRDVVAVCVVVLCSGVVDCSVVDVESSCCLWFSCRCKLCVFLKKGL